MPDPSHFDALLNLAAALIRFAAALVERLPKRRPPRE
jgi:hypothetical protein